MSGYVALRQRHPDQRGRPGEGDRETRRYVVGALRQGSAITWDYSDQRIYKGRVNIGDVLNLAPGGTFAGAEAIPEAELADFKTAPTATTIVSGSPPGSTIDDMAVWDDVEDQPVPLRRAWSASSGAASPGATSNRPLITEVTVAFPASPRAPPRGEHAAGRAGRRLHQQRGLRRSGVLATQRAGERHRGSFTAAEAGWTVLLFSERADGTAADGDLTRERLRVRTVHTKLSTEGLQNNVPADIGAPLTSTAHDTTVPHNGYVFFEKARYNPELHDRASRQGPLYPVNREFTKAVDDDLVVVWYRTQEGIHWPYQTVKYSPQWPNTDARLVVASRLGSEGLNRNLIPQPVYARDNFDLVKIYQQPDPSLPGYNPNEERALIRPSLLSGTDPAPPPAAFALRNNLNVTNQTDAYTSDPYVLVQYHDTLADQSGMRVYRVEVEDSRVPFPPARPRRGRRGRPGSQQRRRIRRPRPCVPGERGGGPRSEPKPRRRRLGGALRPAPLRRSLQPKPDPGRTAGAGHRGGRRQRQPADRRHADLPVHLRLRHEGWRTGRAGPIRWPRSSARRPAPTLAGRT